MDSLERIFILQSWAAYCATNTLVDKIFDIYNRQSPAVFGMDSTGPQGPFVDMIRRECDIRNIRIPLRPVSLRDEKAFAIETTIQPVAAMGRLFRPPEGEVKELRAEFLNFPGGMYRDSLDALSCAIRLLPRRSVDESKAMNRELLRLYLHRMGVPEQEIARRLANHA